ncbi:Gfo/Idh/MocA family oxidoreductase (plasmid) [Fusobacterium vincentii]|uniref:Gfo/Idh/MocA family protein n=1 Tax=Fusobacterium TaxID=848 RepID=UPI001EF02639|nr:Gfo/Idh/MocA family oxidoreductase [Fusobacterium nucleatum]MCG6837370.1 Gfo/Idh/MocA family oxidoreductase [Fusobacterium nucleatum]
MLNFVIIGCGRISHKIVDGIVNNKEKAKLVGVSDIVFSKMDEIEFEYQSKVNSKETIVKKENYKELLESVSVDVAIISTESGYHEEIGLYFLENGVNVIIEKPIAMSIQGAQKLVEKAKEKGVKLAACHQNRFNHPIQLLKKAIIKDRLGEIYSGTARVLWYRDDNYYNQASWRGTWKLDGGTFMNQCIHNIDLLNWMMDSEIDTVYSIANTFSRKIEGEDYGVILIQYKNGKIGTVEGSVITYPKNLEETLTIVGEKGTVVIGGTAVNKVNTWRVDGDKEEDFKKVDCGDPNSVYGYGHEALYKDFIEAIEKNRKPLVDGEAGLLAVKIILAAYKSRKTGEPVKFDELENFSTKEMSIL